LQDCEEPSDLLEALLIMEARWRLGPDQFHDQALGSQWQAELHSDDHGWLHDEDLRRQFLPDLDSVSCASTAAPSESSVESDDESCNGIVSL
jgi:hypothetical protein